MLNYYRINDVKRILAKTVFDYAGTGGLYYLPNTVGDKVTLLYSNDVVSVYFCEEFGYYEVFGLDGEEFDVVRTYYEYLCRDEANAMIARDMYYRDHPTSDIIEDVIKCPYCGTTYNKRKLFEQEILNCVNCGAPLI